MKNHNKRETIEMSYEDVVAKVEPIVNEAGYTIDEWIEGCKDWTIRDWELRDLWIGYGAALTP